MKTFNVVCSKQDFPDGTVAGQISVVLTGLNPVVDPVTVLIPDADGVASFPADLAPGDYSVSAQLLDVNGAQLGSAVSLLFTQAAPVSLLVPTSITVA